MKFRAKKKTKKNDIEKKNQRNKIPDGKSTWVK